MPHRKPERDEPLVIASADELMSPRTRRQFIRTLTVGGSVLMLPSVFACNDDNDDDDDDDDDNNGDNIRFDLQSDIGIFRLVHVLEQLEAAFYTTVVGSATFAALSAAEQELFIDLRNTEVIHREFVSAALGTQRVPDISSSINTTTVNNLISSRTNLFGAARLFEHLGVAGLNGAGKYLQDSRNLLIAGKFASVEARHAAALRDAAPPASTTPNTAFAGDDIIDSNGRDVKLEAGTVLSKVKDANVLTDAAESKVSISNAPTANQGVATADFFPATP